MDTIQEKHTLKRRSFFKQLFGGITGGWITGNLFSDFVRSTTIAKRNEEVRVTINSLAVPRKTKDEKISHGA